MSEIKRFGDLVPGDVIMGTNNQPVTVTRAYDEHIPETMFKLEFDDGVTIEASGNHLWYCETSIDQSLHRKRIKDGYKLFKNINPELVEDLETLAYSETLIETTLIDMITLMKSEDDTTTRAIVRVAESIGHIVEETTAYEDLYSGKTLEKTELRVYDARTFAQQLLSLSNKKYRKQWPVIVGQVVTTEALSRLAISVSIPEVKPLTI